MAEKITIARPYAQAVFQLAQQQNALARWSGMLQASATVAANGDMRKLIGNPRVDQGQVAQMFLDICSDRLDGDGRNMIRLLLENRRLDLLTEIAVLFEQYRAEAEGTLEAEVITAFPVDAAQQQKIVDALKARTGRNVTVKCSIDKGLLGGAIIRAGDLVIDGSVQGQLAKLATAMSR